MPLPGYSEVVPSWPGHVPGVITMCSDETIPNEQATNETSDIRQTVATPVTEVQWTPQQASRRRYRFVPRVDGDSWWQIEDEWTGCRWRHVGQTVVTDVSVTAGTERDE
jgi:hypothetical protein